MTNRRIEGELRVSGQALEAAKYIKDFFEKARDETFTFERIVSQGSVSNVSESSFHSPATLLVITNT